MSFRRVEGCEGLWNQDWQGFGKVVVENSLLSRRGEPGKIRYVLAAQPEAASRRALRVLDVGRMRANGPRSLSASGRNPG